MHVCMCALLNWEGGELLEFIEIELLIRMCRFDHVKRSGAELCGSRIVLVFRKCVCELCSKLEIR